MNHHETNERRFCWEQVLKSNRLFRITHVFAPADQRSKLLPVYALFAAVEAVCTEHSDEAIARRKLDWWRSEFAQLDTRGSDHPIIRELVRTGALQSLRRDSLKQLLDDAEARLDPVAPADLDQLLQRCRNIMQPQIELELSVSVQSRPSIQPVNAVSPAGGLAQLIREAAGRRARGAFWWLPLALMARHGISRSNFEDRDWSKGASVLFKELISEFRDRGLFQSGPQRVGEGAAPASRHLYVIGQLQAHALQRLRPGRPQQMVAELNRVGVSQLYRAWRAARRFETLGSTVRQAY